MAYLKLFTDVVGHIAWPIVVLAIFFALKNEISGFLGRIKNAKYKGVELNLEKEFEELKTEAENAGVTIMYSSHSFPNDSINAIENVPEWAFIKSWQEIENLIVSY
tara:strand:- start:501 stop:818 length:318 start_codon:yes stop_codon:yes gene_type:complete